MAQDRITGVVVACISAFLFLYTLSWPEGLSSGNYVLTPYFLPRIVTGAMFVCAIWLMLRPGKDNRLFFNDALKKQICRLTVFVIILISSVFLIGWDFFVGAFGMCVVFLIITQTPPVKLVVLAFSISGIVFYIFRYIFKLMIPASLIKMIFN